MAQPKHKQRSSPSPWPLVMIVGGLALLGAAAFALLGYNAGGTVAPIEVNGAARLKVDRAKVDLGNIQLGEWVDVKFSLTNVGDQPLRFSEEPYVQVAAGC